MHRLAAVLLALAVAGCTARSAPAPDADAPAADAPAYLDTAFLQQAVWDDGQAEVAFYRVERTRNQYGQPAEQAFTVGTYLVKHDFSAARQTKVTDGSGQEAFKYALFYEFESGSYQYKRSYVANAARADLAPLKRSFVSFDWCANQYRELAFRPDGTVRALMRSDDYGNTEATFAATPGAYPPALLPLVVRALDFGGTGGPARFAVQLDDGTTVDAMARLASKATLTLPGGAREAERIEVAYAAPVPSVIGERSDTEETFWRAPDGARRLLRWEAASGRYRMTLVEALRAPYWRENLWPTLDRVTARP
jgi:hypothetical protein